MGLLTLVRHGQASFLSANYDKLSALGERQAALLGGYWAAAGIRFDQVYYGPAERHVRTGEIAATAYRRLGLDWPEPVALPEVDEYQGIEVMRAFLPGLTEKHEHIRAMETEFRQAQDRTAATRIYDRLFQVVTRMWVAGELESPEVESWLCFCERVDRGLALVRDRGVRSGRVVVFTSGGVIAAATRAALDLSPQKTLELSWTSRNASFSEYLFSGPRFSLSSFNNTPHLVEPELLSYR